MTTSRTTTNSVLDPKLAPDQLGLAAAHGQFDTAPISRVAAVTDLVLVKAAPEVADDFAHKTPPTQDLSLIHI